MTACPAATLDTGYRLSLRLLGLLLTRPRTVAELAELLSFAERDDLIPHLAELTARDWIRPRAADDGLSDRAAALDARIDATRPHADRLARLLHRSRLWYAFFTEIAGSRSTWLWRDDPLFTVTRAGKRVLDQETWCVDLLSRRPGPAWSATR